MGVVSGAVLKHGGKVTGVVPYAMLAAGGEADKGDGTPQTPSVGYVLEERGREQVSGYQGYELCKMLTFGFVG